MLSNINDFFDICNIKIELEFINKIKHFDKYEKLKNSLKNNFSEYLINYDLEKIKSEKLSYESIYKENIETQTLTKLKSFIYNDENEDILKYLSGRIYFNKFFELSDIKNKYESKKFSG